MTKEQAFEKISALVERFEDQYESYRKTDYNETLTRRDFIDPFFKALGWDIDNSQGYAEAYREVIHEDKIKIAGVTKAPDYSFKLPGGKRLFFLEAKKPSVLVKEDIQPAYQVRSYAYSSGMPISIITDFEEFAVYDCTKKPLVSDKASVGRIRYLTYKDYEKEFDFIWETFSKERVLKGGFDKFIQSDTAKKGTATVDKDFLQSLDEWRSLLATTISKNNLHLNEDELNFVLQQTLDRIIFLRIAEDRGVEPYGNLKNALKHGTFYNNVFDLFRQADEKYNSGLFDFKKDKISKNTVIDNKTIKTIIEGLYFPISPFRFAVMPVEIMGSAYEQFLGKQITLDKNHKANIDDKPEVRKAGGVYYTPQYVVDYIVANTVGKLLKGKKPKDIAKLKIVDPACGSGSFLIGAYQCLLDYHKNYYTENGKNIKGAGKPLTPDGNLTTAEKKRILLNNIFGVDIDFNAVEVTKLSLLLKCMEGETEASISMQLKLFNDRVLPTLDDNIKSGNSLIDTDFYDSIIDFGDERKIKPFNWKKAFPKIFDNGGFDVVIGNPPWGADLSDVELAYLRKRHKSIIVRMIDTYLYFVNFSITLIRKDGIAGLIIPGTFLNQSDVSLLRKKIIEELNLSIVVNLGEKVFGPKVLNTSTIVAFSKKKNDKSGIIIGDLRHLNPIEKSARLNSLDPKDKSSWTNLVKADANFTYPTFDTSKSEILTRLKSKHDSFQLILDGEIQRGISPDYAKAFIVDKKTAANKHLEKEKLRPLVLGKHIFRYSKIDSDDLIIYLTKKDDIENYPNIKKHLQEFRKFITCREVSEGKHPWYSLHRPRDPEIFMGRKFIGLTTTKKITISIDDSNFYATDALYLFKLKKDCPFNEECVLGILHSRLFQFLYNTNTQGGQRVIPQVKAVNLYDLPFPKFSRANKEHTLIHDHIVQLVNNLYQLNDQVKETTLPEKLERLRQRILSDEEHIDKLVYKFYGLTDREIQTVEPEFSEED